MMRTGFQAAVERRIREQGWIRNGSNGINFGMRPAEFMVITFPDDTVAVYNHSPYLGIRLCHSQAQSCQLETAAHVYFIFLGDQGYGFITIFD